MYYGKKLTLNLNQKKLLGCDHFDHFYIVKKSRVSSRDFRDFCSSLETFRDFKVSRKMEGLTKFSQFLSSGYFFHSLGTPKKRGKSRTKSAKDGNAFWWITSFLWQCANNFFPMYKRCWLRREEDRYLLLGTFSSIHGTIQRQHPWRIKVVILHVQLGRIISLHDTFFHCFRTWSSKSHKSEDDSIITSGRPW